MLINLPEDWDDLDDTFREKFDEGFVIAFEEDPNLTLQRLGELYGVEESSESSEITCAECEEPIDLESVEEDRQPEYDLEEVTYRSGATEKLQLIFHAGCNISRIKKLAELEELEAEEQALLVEVRELNRRLGLPLDDGTDI